MPSDGHRALACGIVQGTEPPGRLIGRGRTADVYALDAGRVLRRYRERWDATGEARIMRHLDAAGYPVPRVYDVDGPDLVMERLDGVDMLTDLGRRPWRLRRHARTLADLHNRLHAIAAPPGVPEGFGPGESLLHLDLHPGNVMLTNRGPVVIDWSSIRVGAASADVAMTYLVISTSDTDLVPPLQRPAVAGLRAGLLRCFLDQVRDSPWPQLARVVEARLADFNVRPAEAERLRRAAARAEKAAR